MVALSTLRTRWATFVGSFVALAIGVGLIAIMGLGVAATFDAPERVPERFASSPVVVMGTDTLTVEVERGPNTGHVSKKLAHPHLVDAKLLRELRSLGPVVLKEVAAEDRDPGSAAGAGSGAGAGRGADAGGVDAVGVDAPVDEVRAVVGDRARVLTGIDRRLADPGPARDAEALVVVNSVLGTAGGVTTFVSVFVVASTFAFAVAVRRREFGLLRTAGATPGQLRRLLLAEATVVGALAAAAGCLMGTWGAPRLARVMVEGGLAPEWFAIGDDTWPLHAAFWTGLLVALAGAWAASRRAGRISPVEALRESSVDSGTMPLGRRLLGYGLLLGGAGLLAWALATDPSELLKRKTYTSRPMVLITAVALLAPLLVRPVARAVRLPGATGMLVRENTAASLRRTAAIAAPVLVTVALAGSLLGSAETITAAKAAEAREHTAAELVVTGEDLGAAGDVAGVAALSPSASTAVYVREEQRTAVIRSDARAVTDPAALAKVARLPVVAGNVRDLDDRSIIVNEEWERHEVGQGVDVWLGDGRKVALRIVAVLAIGTGDNGAYVTAANAPSAPVDRIDVQVEEGAEKAAVASALRASTGGEVATVEDWLAANHPRTSSKTRHGLWLVLGIALVYTAIALANTLLMANSARSAELAALRMTGATRMQVLGVVAGESLFAVGIGAVLGMAVSALSLAALGTALATLSAPVAFAVPWGTVGVAAGCCGVVAVVAGVVSCPRGR
ncbi:FtsX-like permease family protein [Streptomyces sp. ISL-98]|uniref:ABC transporter permease n=1 Tax=Streptomyces sp. ISL-98 TaxID=2819192 RepID=UPI001BEC8A6B|nr:FtsX-like permease family protein [Streptomyces sp. ISL-98]MBT2506885.1 FtsX-like permease family protein [Streptomyces sp. ISL-98]